MNQILQVQERKNKKTSKPLDTKKIVLFFAICIIIFGLIMLVEGAYSIYQNKSNEKVNPSTGPGTASPQEPEYIYPTINLTRTEDDQVIINIQSEVALSHIVYDWNNENSHTLEETGKTTIEEIIDIPVGENVLNITVIDSNGKETKKSESYVVETSKPAIGFSIVGKNIKVNVTSKVELSYITYKWNSEQEQKYDMLTFEDRTKFEKQLEIPKGQNTLKIVAVDINGNKSEESKVVEGVPKAKTKPVARGEYIYFTVTAETYNIKTVEFEFNGKKYIMNTDTFGQTKVVNYKVKMVEGWNYLKVTSTLQKEGIDTTDTTIWKFEYNPQ